MSRKPFLLATIAAFSVLSCLSIPDVDNLDPSSQSLPRLHKQEKSYCYDVSLEEANSFISIHFPNKEVITMSPYIEEGDTLLFCYSFNKGWAVISGDKRFAPVVAFDDETTYSFDQEEIGPALWIYSYAEDILKTKKDEDIIENEHTIFWNSIKGLLNHTDITNKPSIQTKSNEEKWCVWYDGASLVSTIESTPVNHLIETKWGQKYPWNTKAPLGSYYGTIVRCPTGCTAVAMAQVVYYMNRYFGEPQSLYHGIDVYGNCIDPDHPTYSLVRSDFVASSDRWYHMAKTKADTTYASAEYVCNLMLDIGDRIGMHYSGTGSGGWPSSYGFSFFDLSCSSRTSYSYSTVLSNLNNSLPVIVVAYSNSTGGWFPQYSGGHTWLIDGYKTITYVYSYHYHIEYSDQWVNAYEYFDSEAEMKLMYPNGYDGYSWSEESDYSTNYLLMNWGYDGYLDTGLYPTFNNSSWNGYQYSKYMYYDISLLYY